MTLCLAHRIDMEKHTWYTHALIFTHIHIHTYSQGPGMSEKNPLMVRPSLLICRLSWHWQSSPEVPWPLHTLHTHTHITHTHMHTHTGLKSSMEPAGSQTALTCCLWQPKRRRLAPSTDNMLFVPLSLSFSLPLCHPVLTVCRLCHHSFLPLPDRLSSSPLLSVSLVTLCLCVHLAHLLFLSPSFFLSLSLSLSISNTLVAMRAVCEKQLSTLSQITEVIPCKYTLWWRWAHVLQGSHRWSSHKGQTLLLWGVIKTWRSNVLNISLNVQYTKCAVGSTCFTLNALACISEARSSWTEGVRERCECPSRQEEHRGCKQPGCDISSGWVTDVQLYNVAFMSDLSEISMSQAGVPPYTLKTWWRWREERRVSQTSISYT